MLATVRISITKILITCIIQCTRVSFYRGPNVLGTVHVIELAASHNIPLHHVSSISVADSVL